MHRKTCSLIVGIFVAGAAASAGAQTTTPHDTPVDITPGGATMGNPDMNPGVRGNQIPVPPSPQDDQGVNNPAAPDGAPTKESGIYYNSEDEDSTAPDEGLHFQGNVPDTHVVRRGDTLWDICYFYFNNPWEWPKIWSYNPSITNPHWIYPGDIVRLYPAGQGGTQAINNVVPEQPEPAKIERRVSDLIELRQLAFVGNEDLKFSGKIVGAAEEKSLLSPGDEVFIEYPAGQPPQLGHRYAIYSETEQVKHPDNGAVVGSYVLLRGELAITEVKKDKRARGQITYVTDTIERGMRVGTMKTQFKNVKPITPDKDLEGVVVARIGTEALIGEREVVFIDRGADDGVKVGHTFKIVRRGDAKIERGGPTGNVGEDDRTYPDHSIGTVVVVEVAKNTSVCVVIDSKEEAGVGDHVVMRKPKK